MPRAQLDVEQREPGLLVFAPAEALGQLRQEKLESGPNVGFDQVTAMSAAVGFRNDGVRVDLWTILAAGDVAGRDFCR